MWRPAQARALRLQVILFVSQTEPCAAQGPPLQASPEAFGASATDPEIRGQGEVSKQCKDLRAAMLSEFRQVPRSQVLDRLFKWCFLTASKWPYGGIEIAIDPISCALPARKGYVTFPTVTSSVWASRSSPAPDHLQSQVPAQQLTFWLCFAPHIWLSQASVCTNNKRSRAADS